MELRRFILAVVLLFLISYGFVTGELQLTTSTSLPTQTSNLLTPAYIPPGCASAAQATISPATELAVPTPILQANLSIGRDLQLRVFDKVVYVITQVYVYPDFNGKNWNEIQARYRAKIEAGLDTEDFYTQIEAMIAELGDHHSMFESPAELAASGMELTGKEQFVGIGVSVLPQFDTGNTTVVSILPNSPAEHSGIKPHDSLIAVDGHPLIEGSHSYLYTMLGPECSVTRMTLHSPGQAPHDVMIVRNKIEGGPPVDSRLVPTTDGSRVGYIFIPSFFDETIPSQVRAELKSFGKLDGLILDNRMNGGGSSDIMETTLAYFDSGMLGTFHSRIQSQPLIIRANPIENSDTVPLVVLVDKDTISNGEIFSGILQDSGRAKLVGQTTSGRVETLHGYDLDDGSRLWIAQETFDPAVSHANWARTGIVPDVQAYADWSTFTFATDPSVAAALKLLGHK